MHRTLPLILALTVLGGCATAEQRMITTVDRLMARESWDDALSYLDRYLSRHDQSLAGWRYRVMIRLDQEDRPQAAAEYAALNEALKRQEPDVLREVVLGAGGRWLIGDYRALARCAPPGVADVDFFRQRLQPQELGQDSMTRVAISADEIGAVIDALPGRLAAGETWPLVAGFSASPEAGLRRRVVAAAGRFLSTEGLSAAQQGEALGVLAGAALDPEGPVREQALRSSAVLPAGPGLADVVAGLVSSLNGRGDAPRAVALFLMGPGLAGPTAWGDDLVRAWSADPGPLGTVALVQSVARGLGGDRLLGERAKSEDPALRILAQAGALTAPSAEATSAWKAADVQIRRRWGPALVRSAAADREGWIAMILADRDALVTAASARALAIPGAGDDPAVDPFLEASLNRDDPATRAAAAVAIIQRGATHLALAVEGLFSRGDDRVINDGLLALLDRPDPGFSGLVAAALRSELPLAREAAVDAAAASCDPADRELMAGLLTDEDPHVAVRAASALYLLVGGG